MDLIESLFVSMGEPDPWGSIINPIWAALLVDVEEAWDRATEPNLDLTSGETPQWGFSSFALQPSPHRCSLASLLGEIDKWIQTRSVLEDTTGAPNISCQADTQIMSEDEGGWAHAAASTVVSSQPEEPPENVRARPQTEASPEAVLAFL